MNGAKRDLPIGRRARSDRGASLIEAAFVLPIVLILVFGIVEFGRFLSVSHGVSTAAREAARYGIATGPSDSDPSIARFESCVDIIAAGKALSGLGAVADADFTVEYFEFEDTSGTPIADCDSSSPELDPSDPTVIIEDGDTIVVTVSRSFDELIPFTGILLPDTISANDRRTIFLVTS